MKKGDKVKVSHDAVTDYRGLEGVVTAVGGGRKALDILVELPNIGDRYFAHNELEQVGLKFDKIYLDEENLAIINKQVSEINRINEWLDKNATEEHHFVLPLVIPLEYAGMQKDESSDEERATGFALVQDGRGYVLTNAF